MPAPIRSFPFVLALLVTLAAAEPPPAAEEPKPPSAVRFAKLLSWAEDAAPGCETDLEGSEPPASFVLHYTDSGKKVSVENSTDQLFAAGWRIINRNVRGYGFEKSGDFRSIDFDIVEELRCSCEAAESTPAWKDASILTISIDFAPGSAPQVVGRVGQGESAREVLPVTINGQLAVYELRFDRPLPAPREGHCSSRFFLALELDQPIE